LAPAVPDQFIPRYPACLINIRFNIITPFLLMSFKRSLSFMFPDQNPDLFSLFLDNEGKEKYSGPNTG